MTGKKVQRKQRFKITKMKRYWSILLAAALSAQISDVKAQYPPGDKWYQNPLGFKPLSLHTSMGFFLPALVTGAALVFTQKDSTLTTRLSVYSEAGATFGYKYPYTGIVQSNTGVDLLLRRWLSVGTEFSATMPFDEYNRSVGFSIRPFARFYAINHPSWKLWFESGGGLICFTDNFPQPTSKDDRLGTQWNGITKYGIGTSVRLKNRLSLLVGIRHLHISNGNVKGADRNPSHDSNGMFAGVSWSVDN